MIDVEKQVENYVFIREERTSDELERFRDIVYVVFRQHWVRNVRMGGERRRRTSFRLARILQEAF